MRLTNTEFHPDQSRLQVDRLKNEINCLKTEISNLNKEVDSQMQSKLDAQFTLKAVTAALDLTFSELGGAGWREATPRILARIETIVDEAERGFRERNAQAQRAQAEWNHRVRTELRCDRVEAELTAVREQNQKLRTALAFYEANQDEGKCARFVLLKLDDGPWSAQ
jgi:hypothetical protein